MTVQAKPVYRRLNVLKFELTKLRHRPDVLLSLLFLIVFSFLVIVPLLQILKGSLTYQQSDLRMVRGSVQGQLTAYHYLRVFTGRLAQSLFFKPFWHSLIVGFGVTFLAMTLGSLFAWVIVRTDIPFKPLFSVLMVTPYMMPSWVIALAWLTVFKNERIAGAQGMFTAMTGVSAPDWLSYGVVPIIICLGLHYYAYSFLLVSGALWTVNSELEEAAAIAGLNKRKILRKITFPIVIPALGSAFVLTFTRSMGTFGTPALLGLPVRFFTIPTQIYASINTRNNGDGYVLALVLVALAGVAIYINSRVIGKRRSFVTMQGKGFTSKPTRLGVWRYGIVSLMFLFIFIAIVLPVVILAWSTLMRIPGDYSLSNLTLHYWIGKSNFLMASGEEGIFRNPGIWSGAWNSIRLGVFAAVINGVLGLLIGYTVVRNRGSKLANSLEVMSFAPYVFPGIAMGAIYLGMFAKPFGPIPALYGTFALLVLIVVVKNMPFSSRSGISAMLQIDPSLEESARLQGASWLKRFRKIIFPLAATGFISGMLLTFITAMRELSLVILLVTPATRVLTTIIFAYQDQDQIQHANGVTLILLFIIIIANILVSRFYGTKSLFGLRNT